MNTCTQCQTTEALKWKGTRKGPLLCNSCYRKKMAKLQRVKRRAKHFDMWSR